MGKRSRKGGLANAVLKTRRRDRSARDVKAQKVADQLYGIAVTLRTENVEAMAPLILAAHGAAPRVMAAAGLDVTDEKLALDVAGYIVSEWLRSLTSFDTESFRQWASEAHEDLADLRAERGRV